MATEPYQFDRRAGDILPLWRVYGKGEIVWICPCCTARCPTTAIQSSNFPAIGHCIECGTLVAICADRKYRRLREADFEYMRGVGCYDLWKQEHADLTQRVQRRQMKDAGLAEKRAKDYKAFAFS